MSSDRELETLARPDEPILGAYALGAVEPDEMIVIDLHLAGCRPCHVEFTSHLQATPWVGESSEPPRGVWDKISAQLAERRLASLPRTVPAPSPPRHLLVSRSETTLAGIGATFVALAGAPVAVLEDRAGVRHQVPPALQISELSEVAFHGPEARPFVLHSDDDAREARAVIVPDGQAFIVSSGLADLSAAETYPLGP